MVSNNTRAAIILGVALILSAFLYRGIYESHTGSNEMWLWRLNRFTGEVVLCSPIAGGTCSAVFPARDAASAGHPELPTPAPGESDAAYGKRLLAEHPELDAPAKPHAGSESPEPEK